LLTTTRPRRTHRVAIAGASRSTGPRRPARIGQTDLGATVKMLRGALARRAAMSICPRRRL